MQLLGIAGLLALPVLGGAHTFVTRQAQETPDETNNATVPVAKSYIIEYTSVRSNRNPRYSHPK